MSARRLDVDEYPGLAGVADGFIPAPGSSIAIVSENAGVIDGRMCVVFVAHLEGSWVAEKSRGGTVVRRMFSKVAEESKAEGLKQLMAYSTSGEHDAYLHRLGFERMPWTVWRKTL